MTRKQKLELRASSIRSELATLADVEKLTDEQKAKIVELRGEYVDVETKIQCATIAGDEPEVTETRDDGEARELADLRGRIRMGSYVRAAVEMRAAQGAEAEYNEHMGIGANRFPMELLAPRIEQRAETDVDAGPTRPRRWLDRLLDGTAASRIGITFESVEPGIASFPLTSAGATGAQKARMETVSAATWTINVVEAKPKRNTAHLIFSSEDAARIPQLEDALVRDLRMGVMEAVDRAVFLGDAGADGTDADIVGLNTATSIVEKSVTQANKVKGPNTLQAFIELVDGMHAESAGDLRVVAAEGANTLWHTTIANSTAENQTLAQFLMASGINWTVRGGIETVSAAGDWGAFIGRGRGIDGAAVAAVWSAGEMIRDPYTSAAKGEVNLTLAYLWDFKVVRASNYARLKFVA